MTEPAPGTAIPRRRSATLHLSGAVAVIGALSLAAGNPLTPPPASPSLQPTASAPAGQLSSGPAPLLSSGKPVTWWFAYKFDSASFPTATDDKARACPFGGQPETDDFSQKYVVASSDNPDIADGPGLIGASMSDPLGATFDEIYNGDYYYVVWNDQFYNDPARSGRACDAKQCGSPWGHSKGVVAWDQAGDGVLLQVSTPSWPGAGSQRDPRVAGNTLGCVTNDNNVSNAQDFFALRLNRDDLKVVLQALATASVSTDVTNPQIVNRQVDGQADPADIDQLVGALGQLSATKTYTDQLLSSGVRLIVKPSGLHVPPWQFVSSRLGGEPLLTATWWASPRIPSTHSANDVHCWDGSLTTPSGEVEVATKGTWEGTDFALTGAPNHAKIGASLPAGHHYAIFGDLNQQGSLGDAAQPNDVKACASSQNGRGGMFFVMDNPALSDGVVKLISKEIAGYPS